MELTRIHHVEFLVGNAKQAAYFYRKAFGFDQVAYRGPETGYRKRASYVLRQGDIWLVFTTPLHHDDSLNIWLTLHGDGVRDIAFEVGDAAAIHDESVARGAISDRPPREFKRRARQRARWPRSRPTARWCTPSSSATATAASCPASSISEIKGEGVGLQCIDHVVGNVEDHRMDSWVKWYDQVLGMDRFVSYDDKDISTEFTALRSTVVATDDRRIKFPINEPAEGRKKSQIQEYIDHNVTAGVQHLALKTDDILATIAALRAQRRGVPEGARRLLRPRLGARGPHQGGHGQGQGPGHPGGQGRQPATCCSCSPGPCRTGRPSSSRSSSARAARASARATSRPCS